VAWGDETYDAVAAVRTAYSFGFGLIALEELVERAVLDDHSHLALTDIGHTAALLPLLQKAKRAGINIIPGVEIRLNNKFKYSILALNRVGLNSLHAWLSAGHTSNSAASVFSQKESLSAECACIYPWDAEGPIPPEAWIGVRPWEIWAAAKKWGKNNDRCIAWMPFTLPTANDFKAHRVLRAIGQNALLENTGPQATCDPREVWMTRAQWEQAYQEAPVLVQRTDQLLKSCTVSLPMGAEAAPANLQTYTDTPENDIQLLRQLCEDLLPQRYPKASREVRERVEKELATIQAKGFNAYFLINWDLVRYAQSRGFHHVGRGSGANSIVAYILQITNVDPIELDLYFERFINIYRTSPPDFDLDFSWTDRPEVTRYLFSRYDHVALLGAYSTYQFRSVVREVSKAFGLPKTDIDRLANGEAPKDQWGRAVLHFGHRLHNLPSRMTLHSSGILIANKPLTEFTSTFLPPKGYPTVHFDMLAAEDIGLAKFDILGQRGIAKIADAARLARTNQPDKPAVNLSEIQKFKSDPAALRLLSTGGAMGCFYVESPAMRMLMTKLQTNSYVDLVAASSIIRPGVSSSGMMRQYIVRHRQPERRSDAIPALLSLLPDTYGVMVYQEDVIKVAHHYGGLTLAEADVLRRSMSGKFRSREEFHEVRAQFFKNGEKRGAPPEELAEIWRQMESFAGYAFAKGHSASYAVESFQSLYLKAHFPLEYLTATLNNGGGFYRKSVYVREAMRCGARIEPPCVNQGGWNYLLDGNRLFIGFSQISGVDESFCQRIEKERTARGPFDSLGHFVDRMQQPGHSVPLETLLVLIRVGAFRFAGIQSRALLWEAHRLLGHKTPPKQTESLFESRQTPLALPVLQTPPMEQAFEEWELLGFPLCDPTVLLAEPLGSWVPPDEWPQWIGRKIRAVGQTVSVKDTRTAQGQWMKFGTFEDPSGQIFDTVHFPPVVQKYPFRGGGIYELEGVVSEEFEYCCLDVHFMRKLILIEDPRYADQKAGARTQSPILPEPVSEHN
jgi:DNA polymerase-3 subunit alpha